MKKSSHSLPPDPIGQLSFTEATTMQFSEKRIWQVAQDRALLYLRALDLAPQTALELAMKALRCAEADLPGRQNDETVAAAMRCLHRLLRERGHESLESSTSQGNDKSNTAPLGSMPPLKRGSMVPEVIDRQPWISVILRSMRGRTKTGSSVR